MAWLGTWRNRIKITIDPTKIDGDLENFPFKLCISASSGIDSDDISLVFDSLGSDANRKKIAVTTSDEVTQCYVEIESWDDGNEIAWLHIKVPAVSSTVDTDLYFYYDPSQSDNTTYVGDTGDAIAQNVWDSNFISVFHMNQDPSGGAGCILDSTATGNNGTPVGTMLTEDLIDGQYGKAIAFDGTNDGIALGDLDVHDNTAYTVEFFETGSAQVAKNFWTETRTTSIMPLIFLGTCAGSPYQKMRMLVRDPDNTMRLNIDSTGNVADGSPHYVAWADNAGNYNVYIDGVGDKSGSYTKNPKACNQSHIAMDGRAGETSFFAGTIYELRLSSVKRTSEWVKATNHSLFDNLYSIELPDNTYIVSEVFSLSASLSGSRFINFAHILSPAFLLSSTLAGERIGACLISAPTLTGAFSFSPSATIIRAKDILAPDFTLESSFSASIEAATIILSQVMNLSFSLLSDSQRIYWRDYFYLINSIPFDGTFALVNSLNTGVSSQVLLLNNVLAQIQGQLIVKNRFRDLVLIEGTNRIVNVLEGLYSTGEYYLDESHGI